MCVCVCVWGGGGGGGGGAFLPCFLCLCESMQSSQNIAVMYVVHIYSTEMEQNTTLCVYC